MDALRVVVAHGLGIIVAFWKIALVSAAYALRYRTLEFEIPVMTRLVLWLADLTIDYWFLLLILLLPVLGVDAVVFYALRTWGGKMAGRIWAWGGLAALVLFFLLCLMGLRLPFMAIMVDSPGY
jgi:hypothetical protein